MPSHSDQCKLSRLVSAVLAVALSAMVQLGHATQAETTTHRSFTVQPRSQNQMEELALHILKQANTQQAINTATACNPMNHRQIDSCGVPDDQALETTPQTIPFHLHTLPVTATHRDVSECNPTVRLGGDHRPGRTAFDRTTRTQKSSFSFDTFSDQTC